jgi:Spy/CpxP family protein refolding chaperone
MSDRTRTRFYLTRRAWMGVTAVALLGIGLAGASWLAPEGASAGRHGPGGWMGHGHRGHGGFRHHEIDEEHIRKGLAFALDDVDASDAQVDEIAGILAAALPELQAMREGHRAKREAFLAAFEGERVDRASLEALRAEALTSFDAASQQLLQTVADAADVLTPEQRAELALRHHHDHDAESGD